MSRPDASREPGEPDEPFEPVPFSDQLEAWLSREGPKTIGDLGTVFGRKSFAVTTMLLMFVPALPLPTGGVSHVFEIITIVIAAQLVIGRDTLWLPQRWRGRPLGALTTEKAIPFMTRWIRRLERISRRRGERLLALRVTQRVIGLALIGTAVTALLAPPFSGLDTLPGMAAVVISLGIILSDLLVVAIGVVLGAAGLALIVTVGAALFQGLRHFFF